VVSQHHENLYLFERIIEFGCLGPWPGAFGRILTGGVQSVARTLYVGNLPWSTSEEELAQAFSRHAQVLSARIITDRETGRSRGFGFVEVSDEDAERAVEAMNGTQLGGRDIIVNEARPRQSKY
jgi:RNA recognition motif-containing protein